MNCVRLAWRICRDDGVQTECRAVGGYEQHLRGGKYLVIAHGSAEQVEKARTILQNTGPTELNLHVPETSTP